MVRSLVFSGIVGLVGLVSNAAFASAVLVDPANPNGWVFSNTDNSPNVNASGGFVSGPATPPLGTGSANLMVNDTVSSEILENLSIDPGALNDNFGASYSTYVSSSSSSHSGAAPTLQFDLFTTGGTYAGRLVFDPGLLGSVQNGVWQTWDTNTDAAWYFSNGNRPGKLLDGECSIAGPTYCTLSTAISDLNALNIDAVDVLFKAGSGATIDGNVDNLVLTINGSATTYDFDPNPVPEPASMAMLGTALLGFGVGYRRRRKG